MASTEPDLTKNLKQLNFRFVAMVHNRLEGIGYAQVYDSINTAKRLLMSKDEMELTWPMLT